MQMQTGIWRAGRRLTFHMEKVSMAVCVVAQTIAKCAKMLPVMLWGTLILRKTYTVKVCRPYCFREPQNGSNTHCGIRHMMT